MKNCIGIIFTDLHLRSDNSSEIYQLVIQAIQLASDRGVSDLICLGDVFDSRRNQDQVTLTTFKNILDSVSSYNKTLHLIPGNHDKTHYLLDDSFLDPFLTHPGVQLYRTPTEGYFGDLRVSWVPYYSHSLYKDYLSKLEGGDILFSHIDLTGSTNNGKVMENVLKTSDFKKWKLVLLGHFHNYHIVSKSIVHLPSICQNNFGEDTHKGFTLLYNDLSTEFVKSSFREYHSIEVDVEDLLQYGMEKFIQDYDTQTSNVRIKIKGSIEKIKSLDLSEYIAKYGVSVVILNSDVSEAIKYIDGSPIIGYDSSKIRELFKEYCLERDYDFSKGVKYLDKVYGT